MTEQFTWVNDPLLPAGVNKAFKRLQRLLALLNVSIVTAVKTVTANYSIVRTDGTILVDTTAGAVTVTLPLAAEIEGRIVRVKKINAGANNMIVDGNGAETIDGAANLTTNVQWTAYTLQSTGTQWVVV